MQLASKHYTNGLIILGSGIAASSLSFVVQTDFEKNLYMYSGGAIALIVTIFMIESNINIGRAGFIMNAKGIGVKIKL